VNLRATFCVTAGLVAVVASGCSKSAATVGSGNARLFASADASVKADWNAAMSAFKTNGYAAAIVALGRLSEHKNLSAEQFAAVKQTAAAISDQMWTAANKGDPDAVRAISELRKIQQR
jgi:hypothetical protein